jgi:hypothetical protein
MNTFTAGSLFVCLLPLISCSGNEGATASDGGAAGAPILEGSGGGGFDFTAAGASAGSAGDGSGGSSGQADGAGEAASCSPSDAVVACVGETYAGESIPLDIYLMFDQSGSMCSCLDAGASQICPNPDCSQTRLDAVREAISQFSSDPASAGIGVGLGYFGKQPIGQASCDASEYEAPAVEVGELPEHAATIMAALNQVAPTGETPTGAAIRGACTYASSHKRNSPGHQVVILLLTDGKPEAPATCQDGAGACCPTLADAVAAAEDCRTGSDIETYVLGVGPLLENLEQIAVAGGTERAYLVEGGDVSSEVLGALNRIRGDAAIPCHLQLPRPPDRQTLVHDQVNLEYESARCEPTLFSAVPSASECGTEDGWYYDDPSNPHSIELCPRSCDRVSGPGGSLQLSVGCETRIR